MSIGIKYIILIIRINVLGVRRKDVKDKIDDLRELLHKEIDSDQVDYNKVLKISKELDELIVKYYKDKQLQKERNINRS